MSTKAKKHTYKATIIDGNGVQQTFTRTSSHDYKYFWYIVGHQYGWNMENGQKVEYSERWSEHGFSSTQRVGTPNFHRNRDYDEYKDWHGNACEHHQRIVKTQLVPVEIIK